MPVRAVCPECGATTSLDDPTSSPTLTCHQCGGTVTIPTPPRAGPPPLPKVGPPPLPAPAPAPAPAAEGGFEVLEDSADSAVAVAEPPNSRRPARKAAPPPDEEEYEVLQDIGDDEPEADDEDDAVEVSVAADEDDDEVAMDVGVPRMRAFVGNFEPGDRPLPKRKGVKSSGSGLMVVGLVLVALLLVGGGAAGVFFLWPDKDDGSTVVSNEDPGTGEPANSGPNAKAGPVVVEGPRELVLPGKVTDVCAGLGGTKLLVHCAAEKKLFVVDVNERRIKKEIPTAGPDTLIAAGLMKFLVIDAKATVVQRWDFGTLAMDDQANLPWEGRAKAVSLSNRADGPALVVMDGPADVWPVFFLDPMTFKPADVAWLSRPSPLLPRDLKVRAAANGSAWVGWTTAPANGVAGVTIRVQGKRALVKPNALAGSEYRVPGPVNEVVYEHPLPPGFAREPVVLATGKRPPGAADRWVPAAANCLTLVFPIGGESSELIIKADHRPEALAHITPFPRPAGSESGLTADQVVTFPETLSVAAVIPPSADRIEFVSVPFATAIKEVKESISAIVSLPPTTFRPGQPFKYAVRAVSTQKPVKYTLHRGPPNATISPEGVVTWHPPHVPTTDRFEFTVGVGPSDTGWPIEQHSQSFTVFNADMPTPKTFEPKPTKKKTPEIKPKEPGKKSPDPMPPVVVDPIAPGARLVNAPPERTPITAPTLTDPFPVTLGGPVRDICVGGGGRYLIAHVPTIRKLVIFDVSAVKVAGTINLGADAILFAAGMSKLLVVYPDDGQVLRYGLPDGKLEKDAEIDVRPKPVAAAMGSATAGPLVLGGPVTQNNASKLALTFIDVETLKEVRIDKADGDLRIGFGAAVHLRVSADGQTVATWYRQLQPSGIQLVKLAGNTLTGVHKAVAVGHVVPAPAGGQVFTEKGMYDPKGEPVGRREVSLPATHGTDFLTITAAANGAKKIAVWRGGDQPAAEFTTLPGFDGKKDPFERDNPALALDDRLFLVPDANVLVVVPSAGDRFVVYPLTPAKK